MGPRTLEFNENERPFMKFKSRESNRDREREREREMPLNEERARSVRKALRDVANNYGGGRFSKSSATDKKNGRFSKSSATAKKKDKEPHKLRVEEDEGKDQNEDTLDRLLLLQSDLSALVHQIDELVVQAFKCKGTETKEVESFTNFLSEILSSMKPWVPRLQKSLSAPVESTVNQVESVEVESPQGSLISPSPLVSWRADCTIERGRHLFKLTPLPISKSLSSKPPIPSKSSVFERISSGTSDRIPFFHATFGDANDDLLEFVATKPTPNKPSGPVGVEPGSNIEFGFVSPPMFLKQGGSMVVNVMTPCLKTSPPKSCVLLEPILESSPKGHRRVHKSTPFPVGFTYCSESSGSEVSEDLAFRYPELLALQQAYKSGPRKKHVEASPEWCMSPPKTCVLLNPPDEESSDNADFQLPQTSHLLHKQMNLYVSKGNDGQGGIHQVKTSCLQEPVGGRLALIGSTPIWKEAESVVRTGKRPGENTLKRELWTKFEAASSNELLFNDCVTHKGFLDRLDEVS